MGGVVVISKFTNKHHKNRKFGIFSAFGASFCLFFCVMPRQIIPLLIFVVSLI